jgi:hypothetical protein
MVGGISVLSGLLLAAVSNRQSRTERGRIPPARQDRKDCHVTTTLIPDARAARSGPSTSLGPLSIRNPVTAQNLLHRLAPAPEVVGELCAGSNQELHDFGVPAVPSMT